MIFFLIFFYFWTSHIDKLYSIYPLSCIELQSKKKKINHFPTKTFSGKHFPRNQTSKKPKKKIYKRQKLLDIPHHNQ